jgi:hypothetical protein
LDLDGIQRSVLDRASELGGEVLADGGASSSLVQDQPAAEQAVLGDPPEDELTVGRRGLRAATAGARQSAEASPLASHWRMRQEDAIALESPLAS